MNFEIKTTELDLDAKRLMSFPSAFWVRVAKKAEQSIVSNIRTRKQADGSPIKRNTQKTLDRKRRLQRGSRSLIDDPTSHRFIQSGNGSYRPISFVKGRNSRGFVGVTIGFSNQEAEDIASILQSRGYVGWFKVSDKKMEEIAKLYMKAVDKALQKASDRMKKKKPK